jgi:glycosyltransferase involved in cell wall biosynthesis
LPKRDVWLDDFISSSEHSFTKIPAPASDASTGWHSRHSRGTPISGWKRYWRHAAAALADADGIITLFPQLAATAGAQNRLFRKDIPHIAWCFNVGRLPGGLLRAAARQALSRVDKFIVHSSGEVEAIRQWLDLPDGRVRFTHLQCPAIQVTAEEDRKNPFLVSIGSANRDYRTFFEAARKTKLPCVIVAAERTIEGLDVPENVQVLHNLSPLECRFLTLRAVAAIVPLRDTPTAAGQVTVVEALRMHRPVLATDSIGTRDYISHEQTGLLVEAGDPAQLASAMQRLWEDAPLRESLVRHGDAFATANLSDEIAASRLLQEISAIAK